jgi:hypothetical protein
MIDTGTILHKENFIEAKGVNDIFFYGYKKFTGKIIYNILTQLFLFC